MCFLKRMGMTHGDIFLMRKKGIKFLRGKIMGFTKQKTITVAAEDFLERDAVCHAEFEHDKKHWLVQVVQDTDVSNPREDFDYAWTWVTTRGAGYSDKGAMDMDDWHDMEKAEKEKYIYYPLGLLRHSGDTLYAGSGNHWADPGGWDSGCMGVACMTKKKAVREFGSVWKNGEVVKQGVKLTKKIREKAFACLKAGVAEMNMYLHGEVYGVIVTCLETEDNDSCRGFYCKDREEIEQCVKDILPRGMTGEAEDAVVYALEWKW
jgi:hypothetical protein